MSNDIVEVPFNGSMMIAQRFDDGEIYTALKPICENIGIDFNGQKQRLERTPWATMCVMHTVAADGKNRDMTAISRKTLTMWLATIDTNRLSDEQARHNVTVYQQEAAEALDKYFNEGGTIRVSDALLVRDAAKLLSNNSNIQIGEHELRQWLVDNGWIYRQSNQSWCAASSRVRQGHMVMVSSRSHGIHKDGTPFAYPPTPKLTRKGLALIHQRLSEQSFERVLDAEVAA